MSTTPETLHCPSCGHQNPPIAQYCMSCGRSMSTVARPGPVKRSRGKRLVAILGLGGIVLMCACVGLLLAMSSASGRTGSLASATPVPPPDKASAVAIDPRQLVADPKGFKGRNVVLTGRTLTVSQHDTSKSFDALGRQPSYTWGQFMADVPERSGLSESVVAYWAPKDSSIVGSEKYRVWGVVRDTETTRRTLTGAENESPAIEVYAYERIQ